MAKSKIIAKLPVNSIIDPKYREAMKNREPDWVRDLIDRHCTEKTPDGKSVVSKGLLFDLATKNNLDAESLKNLRKNASNVGRIRMQIGNMLRAAARKRHGLYGLDDKFHKASSEFLSTKPGAPEKPTHDRDGNKLTTAITKRPAKAEAARVAA